MKYFALNWSLCNRLCNINENKTNECCKAFWNTSLNIPENMQWTRLFESMRLRLLFMGRLVCFQWATLFEIKVCWFSMHGLRHKNTRFKRVYVSMAWMWACGHIRDKNKYVDCLICRCRWRWRCRRPQKSASAFTSTKRKHLHVQQYWSKNTT